MNYETINWDDRWAALVDPMLRRNYPGPKEDEFRRHYLESTSCSFYVELLLQRLAATTCRHCFAAFVPTNIWPPEAWWRILVRQSEGQPLPVKSLSALRRVVKRMLRDIESEYPRVGDMIRKRLHEEAQRELQKEAAEAGLSIELPDLLSRPNSAYDPDGLQSGC